MNDDVYLKLKELRNSELDNSQNDLKNKLLKIAIRQGSVPKNEKLYLQSKSLANDDLNIRKDIMDGELWDRFMSRHGMPEHHKNKWNSDYDKAAPRFFHSRQTRAMDFADKEFLKNRDLELLTEEVDAQKRINERNELIEELKKLSELK
jgi:hypothetical protein